MVGAVFLAQLRISHEMDPLEGPWDENLNSQTYERTYIHIGKSWPKTGKTFWDAPAPFPFWYGSVQWFSNGSHQ